MNAIKNITIGHTERLYKPVGYTMLANLVNIVPFCLSIEAVSIIFSAFDGSGQPLDTARLWWISGIMAAYMLVMALAERASYRANFRGAYEMSASGRLSLAEHLRKLSLGFLSRRDPGDLSSMLITDFMMAETGISHHLPQLMGAVVMPILAFASLVWIDWRMAVSMFAALPLAMLVLWASTSVQRKLSGTQIQAKIDAGNRLEEYLQGIRVMKAYNLLGDRFVRLREAFARLRRACIRQEALLGRPAEHHVGSCRADVDGPVRYIPLVGRGTFAACLRAVPRGRLPCVRPADFRPDQLCRIPLFLHCRRTHPFADGRAGNERGTAIPGGRRHPV